MAWYDPRTWGSTSRRLSNIESLLATIKQAYLVDLKLLADTDQDLAKALKEANKGIFALLQQGEAATKRHQDVQEALPGIEKLFMNLCKHMSEILTLLKKGQETAQEHLAEGMGGISRQIEGAYKLLSALPGIKSDLQNIDKSQQRSLDNWHTVFKDISSALEDTRNGLQALQKSSPNVQQALDKHCELDAGLTSKIVEAHGKVERQILELQDGLIQAVEAIPGKIKMPEPVVVSVPCVREPEGKNEQEVVVAVKAPDPRQDVLDLLFDAETLLEDVKADNQVTPEEKVKIRNRILGGSGLKAGLFGTVGEPSKFDAYDLLAMGIAEDEAQSFIVNAENIRAEALKLMG